MSLTVNALKVLRRRVLRNHYGEKDESPDEAFMRVARVVAAAERFYGKHESKVEQVEQQFFEIQKNLEFLAGKPLIQAGRPHKTMAACFVLPVEDSMESIFSTLKDNILVLKSGGGTGFNFSHLRSRDQRVGSSGEPAAGPVYFLKMYSQAAKVVRDRGGRQMGSMAILNANHPDIKSFIDLKVEDPGISNFNLSVGVSDQFMRKVGLKGENWPLLDPHSQKILEKISAQELFNCIAKRAWENGDPGLLFLDTTEKGNVTPSLGKLEATNVCGEQPLLPYEACNLGHVVLPSFCQNGQVDFKRLEGVVRLGVRFLDDVIDVNYYSLTKIEEMCKGNRKIGLGVMGFADLLIKMGIAYDSREAVEMAEKIMSFITQTARDESVKLAKERGSFPNFPLSLWPQRNYSELRNAMVTTIAPTGTISIIAGCSPGIEPLFGLGYVQKNVMRQGDELVEVNPLFREIAKRKGFYSEKLMRRVAEKGSVQEEDEVPDEYKSLFKTAYEIDPVWHLRIQAAFQKHTDSAVSKTVNLPHSATVDKVKEVYLLAWKLGCKGVTVYRDRCRQDQVMNIGVKS